MRVLWKTLLVIIATCLICLVLGGGIFFSIVYLETKSDFKRLSSYGLFTSTIFYSSSGEKIAEFNAQRRKPVPLKDISPWMIKAIIAAEDEHFYEHGPINIWSMIRALIKDVRLGKMSQGGSTITQQLVKNLYLTPEKTIYRKAREIVLAYRLEHVLSKDQILNLYLNTVYFGSGAYGIEQAAEIYFAKSAKNLSLEESSLLAGLPRAPSIYSPYKNPELSKRRMVYVLNRMVKSGFIEKEERRDALQAKFVLKRKKTYGNYFIEYAKQYIENRYGEDILYKGGLRVYTTMDKTLQKCATSSVQKGILKLNNGKYDGLQGALLCIESSTGYVKAMVGGYDYSSSKFNRALRAKRGPGSAFKPVIYLTALEQGFSPNDILIDEPIVFTFKGEAWKPQNYERKFRGEVTLREALAKSINVATIRLLMDVGIDGVIAHARLLGITSNIPHNLAIALGSFSLSLKELTTTYAAFGNYGLKPKPIFIKKIIDKKGKIIEENKPKLSRACSEATGFLITNMLRSVIEEGTGKRAKVLNKNIAGKTGTTDGFKDAWFIGFSPKIVTGVWVGYDDRKTIGEGMTGARVALPIWIDFMKEALRDEYDDFNIPPDAKRQILIILKGKQKANESFGDLFTENQ
jgi:penicillin-binding protein 1A